MPADVKNINESFQSGKTLLNNVQDFLLLDYYKTNSVLNDCCPNLVIEIIIFLIIIFF